MKVTLKSITDLALLIAAIITIAFYVPRLSEIPRERVRPSRDVKDLVGKTVPVLTGEREASGSKNRRLVFFLSTRCIHCVNSIPVYKKLLTAATETKPHVESIALFVDGADAGAQFASSNGLRFGSLGDASALRGFLWATPTILLVDVDNKVQNAWVGSFSDENVRAFVSSRK